MRRTPKPAALLSLWSIRDYFYYTSRRPLKRFYRQPILQPCQKMFEFECQTLNKEYMLLHIHKTQTYKGIVFGTKLIYIMVFVPMCAEHPPFTTLILYIWNLYLFLKVSGSKFGQGLEISSTCLETIRPPPPPGGGCLLSKPAILLIKQATWWDIKIKILLFHSFLKGLKSLFRREESIHISEGTKYIPS